MKRDERGGRARLTLARPPGVTGCAAWPPRDGQRDGRAAASYIVITRLRAGARFVARICAHPLRPVRSWQIGLKAAALLAFARRPSFQATKRSREELCASKGFSVWTPTTVGKQRTTITTWGRKSNVFKSRLLKFLLTVHIFWHSLLPVFIGSFRVTLASLTTLFFHAGFSARLHDRQHRIALMT